MKKVFILIAVMTVLFTGLNTFLKPRIEQRDALKTLETVLRHWQKKEILASYEYWKNPDLSPPISGLNSYEIIHQKFSSRKNAPSAQITVKLDTAPGGLLPPGKQWVFELTKTRIGWKIAAFKEAHP